MNVCVLSELSMLFKAIVSRCRDLQGVHFTQLKLGDEGEHSLVRGRIKYTGSKRDPHWVGSLKSRKPDPLPLEREGSGELCIQALSRRTVQCAPITLQYFVT